MKRSNFVYVVVLAFALIFLSFRAGSGIVANDLENRQQATWVASVSGQAVLLAIVSLIVGAVLDLGNRPNARVSVSSVLLVLSVLFYNLRMIPENGIISATGGCVAAISLLIISRRSVGEEEAQQQCDRVAWAYSIFVLVFLIANGVLFITGSGYYDAGFRFSGTSFHPNQIGLIAGVCILLTISLGRIVSGRTPRFAFSLLTGVAMVILMASGSRGAIVATILAVAYYLIASKIEITSILIGILAFFLAVMTFTIIEPDSLELLDRIQFTGDNRTIVLDSLWNSFVANPLYGAGPDADGSENALLKALAVGGIICGVPLVIFMFIKITEALKSLGKRFASAADINTAGFDALTLVILVGSVSDGYLFEKLGFSTAIILITESTKPVKESLINSPL